MLKLVSYQAQVQENLKIQSPEAMGHHQKLLAGYLQSHQIRNHSKKTHDSSKRFLNAWFSLHGTQSRPLYTWEAMEPITGRKRIVTYGQALVESEISSKTIRRYLGILRGYFSYVLEHPYIYIGEKALRICDLYHFIEQPVSEFDIPVHTFDGEQLGVPLDPERLYDFYSILKKHYLIQSGYLQHIKARNYAMVVLAGESGVRVDELTHLEVEKDLFFESKKLQTRYAKGTHGSGKRSRVTLFTPLARDTIRYYLTNHRPYMKGAPLSPYLFPSRTGNLLTYSASHEALVEIITCANKNNFSVAEHMSWHWLRRLFATRFIERFPRQLPTLVGLLGHITPNTVHAYIRHSEAWMDQKILDVLEGTEVDCDPMAT